MVPGANAISDAAISDLPLSYYNYAAATFRWEFRYEAVGADAYLEFLKATQSVDLAYAVVIDRHALPENIET